MSDAEALAQRAVERLSDDESLRGDLTDDGFGPLFDWAVNRAIALAGPIAAAPPDGRDDSLAALTDALRQAVRAAVAAADAGDTAPLIDVLGAPALRFDLGALQSALAGVTPGDDHDANAQAIAAALNSVHVLENAPPAPSEPAPERGAAELAAEPRGAAEEAVQAAEDAPPADADRRDGVPVPAAASTAAAPAARRSSRRKRRGRGGRRR